MTEYSLPEIRLLFEKVQAEEYAARADFIEDVVAGIGGAFGGFDDLKPMLKELRGEKHGK
jgi:hypothetical protein